MVFFQWVYELSGNVTVLNEMTLVLILRSRKNEMNVLDVISFAPEIVQSNTNQ